MRLFVSVKQTNIGFVRVKSRADILPHWAPSNFGLHFQLSHVLKLLSAESTRKRKEDKKGKSAGTHQQSSLP